MNNSVFIYEPGYGSQNIGDYIQSLAAKQFFDKTESVAYIHREHLNDYDGEPVRLIMNGWFTHHPENWPPSSKIHPFFVAFHLNSLAKEKLLRPECIAYLKKYEPIGCRDRGTVSLLQERGIDAYFSGCLTLTLGLTYSSAEKEDKVYFADPYYEVHKTPVEVLRSALALVLKKKTISIIASKLLGRTDVKALFRAASFYRSYSRLFSDQVLANADYKEHYHPEINFQNEDAKFSLAEEYLRQYARAKFVVTSRIHCALPCLGMNTPVLYVNDMGQSEASYCRLDGILELFNRIDFKNGELSVVTSGIPKTYDWNTLFENPEKYKVLRDDLIARCQGFVKIAKN